MSAVRNSVRRIEAVAAGTLNFASSAAVSSEGFRFRSCEAGRQTAKLTLSPSVSSSRVGTYYFISTILTPRLLFFSTGTLSSALYASSAAFRAAG